MREKLGPDFIIIFRLSMLDLVENGSSWAEIVEVSIVTLVVVVVV